MCRSDSTEKKEEEKKDELRKKFGSIVVTLTEMETWRVEDRKISLFLDSWFNIKLLPFSLQILRISILSLHGRNFNLWSVITNCTRLFRPPLAFHLFSSSFLRFFLCEVCFLLRLFVDCCEEFFSLRRR